MISAFSVKLGAIEGKLSDQQKQINDIRSKLVNSFLSDEELDSGRADMRSVVMRSQGQLKTNVLQLNELKSIVAFQSKEIDKLREDVLKLKATQSTRNVVDEEFCSFSPTIKVGVPMSSSPTPPRPRSDISRSTATPPTPAPKNDTQLSPRKEMMFVKAQLKELESELTHKNGVIQELLQKHEEYLQKERDYVNKQDWYEHKMRLLKQDKRRRGETIGKLLRSVDEMRDAGRIDLNKTSEGKGILHATATTRGLPTEERIQAAIAVTDVEKSPRYREPPTLAQLADANAEPCNFNLEDNVNFNACADYDGPEYEHGYSTDSESTAGSPRY